MANFTTKVMPTPRKRPAEGRKPSPPQGRWMCGVSTMTGKVGGYLDVRIDSFGPWETVFDFAFRESVRKSNGIYLINFVVFSVLYLWLLSMVYTVMWDGDDPVVPKNR